MVGLGWGPRFCLSNKFSVKADVAVLRTILAPVFSSLPDLIHRLFVFSGQLMIRLEIKRDRGLSKARPRAWNDCSKPAVQHSSHGATMYSLKWEQLWSPFSLPLVWEVPSVTPQWMQWLTKQDSYTLGPLAIVHLYMAKIPPVPFTPRLFNDGPLFAWDAFQQRTMMWAIVLLIFGILLSLLV